MEPRPPPHTQNVAAPRMFDVNRTNVKKCSICGEFLRTPLRDGESGRRVSNPRPSAWEADALPTELRPRWGRSEAPRKGRWPRRRPDRPPIPVTRRERVRDGHSRCKPANTPCVQPARQLSRSRIALLWPSIPTTASRGCSAADAIVRSAARAPPAVPIVAVGGNPARWPRGRCSDYAVRKALARLAASNGLLIVSWSGRSVARPKRVLVPVSVECAIVSIGGSRR